MKNPKKKELQGNTNKLINTKISIDKLIKKMEERQERTRHRLFNLDRRQQYE